jgi:hypothetical protein
LNKLKDSNIKTTFDDRVKDTLNSKKNLEPTELRVGNHIDIRDEKYDWSVGLITKMIILNGLEHVVVKYRDSIRQF